MDLITLTAYLSNKVYKKGTFYIDLILNTGGGGVALGLTSIPSRGSRRVSLSNKVYKKDTIYRLDTGGKTLGLTSIPCRGSKNTPN